ncbi:HNH endonuclease [Arthrobacter sp. GCM10027362]|uniref:HNH endonuclease n=1 Tax=Arthrobacter sp. GCM10027362 TaxID=3273379 RepID=UPI003643FBEE
MKPPAWTRDEIILACDLVRDNGWKGLEPADVRVIELSRLLQSSPLHPVERRGEKFRNVNGVARKTVDIATQHPDYRGIPTRGNRLDAEVLREFLADTTRMRAVAAAIREELGRGETRQADLDGFEDEDEAGEGRILLALHLRRERSRKLRARKIEAVKRAGRDIVCEVCSFDFGVTYGPRGQDFIEIHHILPLHVSGEVQTRLADLALLCSNCHRMIHRGKPWLTPAQLREVVARG